MRTLIRSTHSPRAAAALVAALVASIAAAGAIAAPGSAAKPKIVAGKVGPGFTIGLTVGGKKAAKLKAGVPYRFVISDRSSEHDFHLLGPGGFSRRLTGVEFTGTKSVTLTLKKGAYHFQCDPHADFMHGSFVVA